MIDRIFNGFVVDYLQLSFFPPVCNLADYCVVIGVVLMLIYVLSLLTFLTGRKNVRKTKRKRKRLMSEPVELVLSEREEGSGWIRFWLKGFRI